MPGAVFFIRPAVEAFPFGLVLAIRLDITDPENLCAEDIGKGCFV
jgi:hypothetical protein